jgi:fatty acid desaturase
VTIHSRAAAFGLDAIDLDEFARDVKRLRAEIDASLGPDDLRHLRRIERWGRLATAIGLATAPLAPNPLSAAALALGRATRWLLMHHIGHRGYDKVPGVPARYTSRVFARGRRRFLDWLDWMIPEAWIFEHNILHHQYTGESRDPDLIEQNLESVHRSRLPIWLRYGLLAVLAATWRASYYAPNTLRAWANRHAAKGASRATPSGMLVSACYVPYALVNFVALPLCFAPLGAWAVFSAWCNSLLADMLTNLYTFFVVGPNHTGDDVFRYDDRPASRGEFYARQVIGSVNYRTGTDWIDYAHLFLNYQIEHHLFPDVPMLAYRRVQPKVEALCARYGVPYVQEPVIRRFRKMARVFVGTDRMRRVGRQAVEDSGRWTPAPVPEAADLPVLDAAT